MDNRHVICAYTKDARDPTLSTTALPLMVTKSQIKMWTLSKITYLIENNTLMFSEALK